MRRWGYIAIWTGGCLALLVIVRSILESAPQRKLHRPLPVVAELGLQPPIVAIGSPVADFAPLHHGSFPVDVVSTQLAANVPQEDDVWRLPPPYQESAACTNEQSVTSLTLDAKNDATHGRPPQVEPPQPASKQLTNSSIRLPSVELEPLPEVRISSEESPTIPSFSVAARIPEVNLPVTTPNLSHVAPPEAFRERLVTVSPERCPETSSNVNGESAGGTPVSTENGNVFAGELPVLDASRPTESPLLASSQVDQQELAKPQLPDPAQVNDSQPSGSPTGSVREETLQDIEQSPTPSRPESFPYSLESPVGAKPKIPVSVAERIQTVVDHGFSLGERGAYYSAREDFLEAIRLVAQSLDAEGGGQIHTQALARGMRALTEAEDFQIAGERLDADFNAVDLSRGHKTSVLQGSDTHQMAPMEAMQHYYAYAEDQLAIAGGEEAVASRAWYALAKLQPFLANGESASMAPAPRALVLHRVALRVNSHNYLAQNELGVLLARYGRYQDACRILEQATQDHPLPATWQNLAVVYHELGYAERSEHAVQQAQQLAASSRPSDGLPVRLVDVDRFRDAPSMQESHSEVARTPQPGSMKTPAQR